MPVEELAEAILTLNENVLNLDTLLKLNDNIPEYEEITAISKWLASDPVNNLLHKTSPSDQFFMGLSKIPQLRLRMDCLLYTLQFPVKVEELQPALVRIRAATTTLQSNYENFHKLLEIVLAFGNFLNSGTSKGNAIGFSIRSLERLTETKGQDKYTLLSIITEYIEDKQPEVSNWTKDLANIKSATKVTYESIQDELKELLSSLKASEQKVSLVNRAESRYDVFYKLMPANIEECRKKLEEIDQLHSATMKDFGDMVEKYGEDPARTKPEEFFLSISNFMNQYENSLKELKLKRIQQKKKLIEEKKKQQLQLQPPTTTPTNNNPSSTLSRKPGAFGATMSSKPLTGLPSGDPLQSQSPPEEDQESMVELVDSAISSLSTGKAFQRRRLRRQDTLRQKQEEASKMGE